MVQRHKSPTSQLSADNAGFYDAYCRIGYQLVPAAPRQIRDNLVALIVTEFLVWLWGYKWFSRERERVKEPKSRDTIHSAWERPTLLCVGRLGDKGIEGFGARNAGYLHCLLPCPVGVQRSTGTLGRPVLSRRDTRHKHWRA
jgi:hypothetical protein